MLAPMWRGYDHDRYERQLEIPQLANPLYAMQDERWKADRLAQVSPAQVSPAQVSPAQVSPAQVSPAQVSPAQVSPAQVSPAQVVPLAAARAG